MNRIACSPPMLALLLAACGSGDPAAPGAEPTLAAGSGDPAVAIESTAAGDAAAATTGIVSQYTSLKDCKVVELREEEDWSTSRCAGLGGYGLFVDYGDARDDLRLVRPGGKTIDLGLIALGGGGFNALADTVEWRGTEAGSAFRPTALIVRNSVVQAPEHPERPTAMLIVIDLAQGCVIAQVKPQSGQNEAARAMADRSRQACLKGAS